MKNVKIGGILLFLSVFLTLSCTKELVCDFNAEVIGASPNAYIRVTNLSENASSSEWTFSGQGLSDTLSNESEPSNIFVDKAGEVFITLKVQNEHNSSGEYLTKYVNVMGENNIVHIKNIKMMAQYDFKPEGIFFSTITQQVYDSAQITEVIDSLIDIAYVSYSGMSYFASPKSEYLPFTELSNAMETVFMHDIANVGLTVEDFNNMTSDNLIKNIAIEHDYVELSPSYLPNLVLFKNSLGRKGIIKIIELDESPDGYVVFDIKMQKY